MSLRTVFTLLFILSSVATATACPFCSSQGQTLAGELASADMIVVATLKSSEQDPQDFTRSKSVFAIDKVIKPHSAFEKATSFPVARYIQQVKKGAEPKFLLFCYINNDPADAARSAVASGMVFAQYLKASVDAYRGDEIKADSKLPDYLEQTFALKDKDQPTRLKFYFDHLESPELFISTDALMEFGNADYKDVRPVAEKLPADTLLKWIKDPNTSPSRFGLYGMLLGHCGKAEHASAVRKLIDDPDNAFSLGLDGMLAGYAMLDPKAGWEHLRGIAGDRKKDFSTRYAALRTIRFFHEFRPEVLKTEQLLDGMKALATQDDIADIAIDDLRKWKVWDETGTVLGFAGQESHNSLITKRAILRFALQAAEAGKADAKEFVDKARADNPERVKETEDLLRDETPKVAPTTTKTDATTKK
jgi:hypothetical protein